MNDKLRTDFPIEFEDDHYVTRREFFKFLTLASGGLAAGSVALAAYTSIPKEKLSFDPKLVCRVEELESGTSLAFSYPRTQDLCLLVRRQDGEFVAYSRRCTHLSCPVHYENDSDGERLYCPCHNGAFSVEDGRVLQGPPPHPIPRITLEQRGDEIWAVGVHKGEHA